MSQHRYPRRSLLFDGVRAGFGLLVTVGPLLFVNVALPVAIVLGALGAIFAAFAIRVAGQALSSIELSDQGISRTGLFAQHLNWSDVTAIKLARFSVPKRSSDGWYQLTVVGRGSVFKVDSTIERFGNVIAASIRAARSNGLDLDLTTGENLKQLGYDTACSKPVEQPVC